jgi:hypothetical protein
MGAPAAIRERGRWEGYTLGTWCEGGECQATLMESLTIVYEDGTWYRSAHDPADPLRAWEQDSADPAVHVTADELMDRFRGYAQALAVVAETQ